MSRHRTSLRFVASQRRSPSINGELPEPRHARISNVMRGILTHQRRSKFIHLLTSSDGKTLQHGVKLFAGSNALSPIIGADPD